MRKAEIYQKDVLAGLLEEIDQSRYRLTNVNGYRGEPISFALPVREQPYEFNGFPAVFQGLLPEGVQLEALLRIHKVDIMNHWNAAERVKTVRLSPPVEDAVILSPLSATALEFKIK